MTQDADISRICNGHGGKRIGSGRKFGQKDGYSPEISLLRINNAKRRNKRTWHLREPHVKRHAVIKRARQSAIKRGESRFYAAAPCNNGHFSAWYTLPNQAGGVCVECRQGNKLTHHGLPIATTPRPDKCELCGKIPKTRKQMHRDHDHVTGRFRGWLCHCCNTSIGKLGDNVDGLLAAIDYLQNAEEREFYNG